MCTREHASEDVIIIVGISYIVNVYIMTVTPKSFIPNHNHCPRLSNIIITHILNHRTLIIFNGLTYMCIVHNTSRDNTICNASLDVRRLEINNSMNVIQYTYYYVLSGLESVSTRFLIGADHHVLRIRPETAGRALTIMRIIYYTRVYYIHMYLSNAIHNPSCN